MFVSKRKIKGKAYFYLEDRVGKKRISILLGNKNTAREKISEGLDELLRKKAMEQAKATQAQFHARVLSLSEILTLEELKINYSLLKDYFPSGFQSFKEDEFVRYAQGSTSVEGNSLNLKEAALVLMKDSSVAGKRVDEIREIENMKKAAAVSKKIKKTGEREILKIHAAILAGFTEKHPGEYREGPMFITASKVKPAPADQVEDKITGLINWAEKNQEKIHPMELASEFHARFELIHPFEDGNGRTGREILNWMLQKNGYPRAIVNLSNRQSYIALLERVQLSGEYWKLSKFIYLCLESRAKEIDHIISGNKNSIIKKLAESVQ